MSAPALDAACEQFRTAIFRVRASGEWRAQPHLARHAADMLGRVEIARQRVRKMTPMPVSSLGSLTFAMTGMAPFALRREDPARS